MTAGFERLAGVAAFFVGFGALVYSIVFITIVEGNTDTEPWFAILMLGALATVPVVIALYCTLRRFDDVIAWLVWASGLLPRGIAYLAALGGALLVFIYIGRLFDFITPGDYVSLIPPIAYGFLVHPLLYGWIGLTYWRRQAATA